MAGHEHNLRVFDGSGRTYIPIIEDAAAIANWRVLPYDNEDYVIEDMLIQPTLALVSILRDDAFAFADYPGYRLIEVAEEQQIPHAILAEESFRSRLEFAAPNLFIPRTPGQMVKPLANWLIGLTQTIPNV